MLTRTHGYFICAIKELKDYDFLEDLSSVVTAEYLQKCSELYHECRTRFRDKSDDKTYEVSDISEEETDPEPCDRSIVAME